MVIKIRKELKKLILKKKKDCVTEKQVNQAVNEARAEINAKYGNSWRSQAFISKQNCGSISPSFYEDHVNGKHWM